MVEVTMAYSQTQVDALKAAIATGALTVRDATGNLITYRSLKDMREILAVMESEVAGDTRVRRTVGTFSNGTRNSVASAE